MQKAGWGEFMSHVSAIMAEQADKVARDSEQDKSLFQCSNTLTALREFFQKCGQFDYLGCGLTPEEYRPLLERYRATTDRQQR